MGKKKKIEHDESYDELVEAFGGAKPPKTIEQEPFDGDDGHYHRLCALAPGERPKGIDLLNYALDLQYQKVLQKELFLYLFPICLQAWREDLFGRAAYAGFVEHFYPAILRGQILEKMLQESQRTIVVEFMRRSILDLIDRQRGLHFKSKGRGPHKWVAATSTYGVIHPDMDALWKSWWTLETPGRAVSACQYISCLMYPEHENPVFDPWTPEEGGGPPVLWEYEGHLYEDAWKPENVTFLERILSVEYVEAKLKDAAVRLVDEEASPQAQRLLSEFPERRSLIESRCAELPRLLATKSVADTWLKWTR